jgi:hypothetical protein
MDARPLLWVGEAFLDKPFSAEGLLEAVSLLLYGTLRKAGANADIPCQNARPS